MNRAVMFNQLMIIFRPDAPGITKDTRQRLKYFIEWLVETKGDWKNPDLNAYLDYLLNVRHLKASSAAVHIGAVKTAYRKLLEDPKTREFLEQEAPNPGEKESFIAKSMAAMQEAISREAGHVKVKRNLQVRHVSPIQIDELLGQITLDRPQGVSDVTKIGLMYCTGMSETELCALTVDDLRMDGEYLRELHVPQVPGGQERTVPIYDHILFNHPWLQVYVVRLQQLTDAWSGPLIRGFHHGGYKVRDGALTSKAVQKMLHRYLITDEEGGKFAVTALDLRRSYARRLYEAGIDEETLQTNLGQKLLETTWEYIGPPNKRGDDPDDGLADGTKLLRRLYGDV